MERTVVDFNKAIKDSGIKLIQTDGYLYWLGVTADMAKKVNRMKTSAVMVNHFSDMTWERWIAEKDQFLIDVKNDPVNQ